MRRRVSAQLSGAGPLALILGGFVAPDRLAPPLVGNDGGEQVAARLQFDPLAGLPGPPLPPVGRQPCLSRLNAGERQAVRVGGCGVHACAHRHGYRARPRQQGRWIWSSDEPGGRRRQEPCRASGQDLTSSCVMSLSRSWRPTPASLEHVVRWSVDTSCNRQHQLCDETRPSEFMGSGAKSKASSPIASPGFPGSLMPS